MSATVGTGSQFDYAVARGVAEIRYTLQEAVWPQRLGRRFWQPDGFTEVTHDGLGTITLRYKSGLVFEGGERVPVVEVLVGVGASDGEITSLVKRAVDRVVHVMSCAGCTYYAELK